MSVQLLLGALAALAFVLLVDGVTNAVGPDTSNNASVATRSE